MDLFNFDPPRFNFRTNRKRSTVVGDFSPLGPRRSLFQLLDLDASDSNFSSWFLDRYQKILPKRITRLGVREQRVISRHTKRMRNLLILNTQSTPFTETTTQLQEKDSKDKSKEKISF